MYYMKKIHILSVFIFGTFLILPSFALAAEQLNFIKSDVTINRDATVDVVERIQYQTDEDHHGILRDIPYKYPQGEGYTTAGFELKLVTDENDQSIKYSTSDTSQGVEIKIGDPDKTFTGQKDYKISYRFKYAINYFDDHDELYLNITGNDWNFPVELSQATVKFNGFAPADLIFKCYTGPYGSTGENCTKQNNTGEINFSSSDSLTVVVGWKPGLVAKVERPFIKPFRIESGWFLLIPVLYLVFMLRLYLQKGRDPKGRITIAPEFSAPDDLRPAQVGALLDERVDPRDVSATIIDFAVCGYLKIEEKSKKEYDLIKIKDAGKDFESFEKKLYNAIFMSGKMRSITDLKTSFYKDLPDIKNALYKDIVDRKLFVADPNKVRIKYLIIGLLLTFLPLGLFTISATLGFSLCVCGVITLCFVRAMPKKTYAGVIARERCMGLREFIYRAERYRVKWQEKEGIFETILPYAMVFDLADKWAKNFKDIYKNPPDWYEGGHWTTFNAIYFVSALNSFSSTAQSNFSPPASSGSSGFSSGGGFSGGGFGGGGGGSW